MDGITKMFAVILTITSGACVLGWHYTPHTGGQVTRWVVMLTAIVACGVWVIVLSRFVDNWVDSKAIDSDDDDDDVKRGMLMKIEKNQKVRDKDLFDFSVAQQKEINRKRRNKRKASRKTKHTQQGR